MEKLQRARSQVKPNTPSQPVLSKVSLLRLVVGNWTLMCRRDGELHILNSDGQQVIFCLLICLLNFNYFTASDNIERGLARVYL